ncbi:MAG TPA: nitrilase-related carbon-nitrogen hydrolase, partial [Acetobacteraceae bacterium]
MERSRIVKQIRGLGEQGVRFATFPETVVPYYPYFSFIQPPVQNIAGSEQRKLLDQAVTVPSAATDANGAAARQAGVVVSIGVNERDGGTLYNTQLLFDADGTLIQRLPFPDGSIIVALHWDDVASEENNKIFGRAQSFIAGSSRNIQFMVK